MGGFLKMELTFYIGLSKNSASEGRNILSSSSANSPLLIRPETEQAHKDIFLLGSH